MPIACPSWPPGSSFSTVPPRSVRSWRSSRDDANRGEVKHALAESQSLLEDARQWLVEAHHRLAALGHPPNLKELPELAARLNEHAEQLAAVLPLLRFMAFAADLTSGPMLAAARPAVGGIVVAVGQLRRALDETDLDDLEREAHGIYDDAFAALFNEKARIAELERDIEASEADSRAGRTVTFDELVARLGGR